MNLIGSDEDASSDETIEANFGESKQIKTAKELFTFPRKLQEKEDSLGESKRNRRQVSNEKSLGSIFTPEFDQFDTDVNERLRTLEKSDFQTKFFSDFYNTWPRNKTYSYWTNKDSDVQFELSIEGLCNNFCVLAHNK